VNAVDGLIARVKVSELFYTYSYDLQSADTAGPESGKLILLYGNNGAGKTTILDLIYHLLNPEPFGGHRSFLGRVPFKVFEIHLGSGIVIRAYRKEKNDPGTYDIEASDGVRNIHIEWTWFPEKGKESQEQEPMYKQFCEFLKNLDITIYYLRDTRRLEGSQTRKRRFAGPRVIETEERVVVVEEAEEEIISPEHLLKQSIEKAIQWFRSKALSGANVGYTSVNSIYRDIIKRMATYGASLKRAQPDAAQELISELVQLKERNSHFAKFGLTPELDIEDIIQSLQSRPKHVNILKIVLGPYLEGQRARLDALQELQNVMNSFISLLENFYTHKRVAVHLEQGLEIRADTGHDLSPATLSSGEKQLLLLFCNAISARKERTILMIDEPEISLNVKWQRELIPALLTCMSGTAFQLVLATHSVELLSRYSNYVTPLENLLERKSNE
jgi:energy-coupling factor transporter ATP-binding protein EcfA2